MNGIFRKERNFMEKLLFFNNLLLEKSNSFSYYKYIFIKFTLSALSLTIYRLYLKGSKKEKVKFKEQVDMEI